MKIKKLRKEKKVVDDTINTPQKPLRLFVQRGPERRDRPYQHLTDSEVALLGLDLERRIRHRREIDIEAVKRMYQKQSNLLYWVMAFLTALFINGFYWIFIY